MKPNDLQLPDVEALVAFGRVGVQLAAARLLSLVSIFGTVALAAYVVYSPSWQGAACVAVVALLVSGPAIRAEAKPPKDG